MKIRIILVFSILIFSLNGICQQKPSCIIELKDTIDMDTCFLVTESTFFLRNEAKFDQVGFKVYKYYYNNGVLKETFFMWADRTYGEYKSYHPNGELKEIYNVIESRIVGPYMKFHLNGSIKVFGNYKSFDCFNEIGGRCDTLEMDTTSGLYRIFITNCRIVSVKEGEWLYYDKDGNLIKKEIYKDGKLEETINVATPE
jgi:MORN repeat variant